MSNPATLKAVINFSDGSGFGPILVLGNTATPLGSSVLGTSTSLIVDVSPQVLRASTRRTYSRTTDTWNTGSAVVEIADQNGYFNPENTASPYYGKIKPMTKIQLSGVYSGVLYPMFSGYIQSWVYTPANGADVAKMAMRAYDGFLLFNNANITTVANATAGEKTGERINDILTQVLFPTTLRSLDVGKTICQADPGTLRTVLNAIQQVEETELGAFYMDANGVATFKDRDSLAAADAASPTVFTDDVAVVPGVLYNAVDFALDDTLIQNAVTVQPAGLTAQYAENAASIVKYFTHSISRTDLLMSTTADALAQAQCIVNARAYDELRIDQIRVDLSNGAPATRVQAGLGLDFLNNIRVVRTAPGGVIDKTLLIHGISHDVTPNNWQVQFQTVEAVVTNTNNY